jgi:hypothetical protein
MRCGVPHGRPRGAFVVLEKFGEDVAPVVAFHKRGFAAVIVVDVKWLEFIHWNTPQLHASENA